MTSVYIIANPSSGQGKAIQAIAELLKLFHEEGLGPLVKLTQEESDIAEYAQKACQAKVDLVVLVGGDGTISHFMTAVQDYDYKPVVGIVPTGTMNNMARSLNIDQNPKKASKQVVQNQAQAIDMGLINGQVFTSTISAGSVPASAREVSQEDKEQYGALAYIINGLQSFSQGQDECYKVLLDGVEVQLNIDLLVIGVANSIAGYTDFFKSATYTDGLLHLFILKEAPVAEKIFAFSKLLAEPDQAQDLSQFAQDADVNSYMTSFKDIKIDLLDKEGQVTMDGNPGPSFPIHVEVIPQFIQVIVGD